MFTFISSFELWCGNLYKFVCFICSKCSKEQVFFFAAYLLSLLLPPSTVTACWILWVCHADYAGALRGTPSCPHVHCVELLHQLQTVLYLDIFLICLMHPWINLSMMRNSVCWKLFLFNFGFFHTEKQKLKCLQREFCTLDATRNLFTIFFSNRKIQLIHKETKTQKTAQVSSFIVQIMDH